MSSCYHNASHSVSHRLLCWCSWRLSCLPRHVSHTFKFHQISPNLSKKHHVKYLPHPFMPVFEVLTAHTWETQKKSAHYAVIKNDASAAGVSVFAFGLTNVVQKQLWTPWSSTVSPDLLPKDFWGFWPRSIKKITCLSGRVCRCCGFGCLHEAKRHVQCFINQPAPEKK